MVVLVVGRSVVLATVAFSVVGATVCFEVVVGTGVDVIKEDTLVLCCSTVTRGLVIFLFGSEDTSVEVGAIDDECVDEGVAMLG